MVRGEDLSSNDKVRRARTLRGTTPVQEHLATALAAIPVLRFVKLFPDRLTASSQQSTDGKKNPVVSVEADGITGVELLIDADTHVVQFYAISSAQKGSGRKMVEAIVSATPTDWAIAVPMDWSEGFWQRMARDFPKIQVL